MSRTVLRSLHPSTESISIEIDYGVNCDYTFILEDGSLKHARVNSLDTFNTINQIANV